MAELKTYLISYNHDGAQWNVEIMATSWHDAENRLWALRSGRVDGELIAKIPAGTGWIARTIVFVARLFRS